MTAHVVPLKSSYLSPHYTLVAICTSSPSSSRAAAKAHGIPPKKAYCDPKAMAADDDVDMVVVSVKVWNPYLWTGWLDANGWALGEQRGGHEVLEIKIC